MEHLAGTLAAAGWTPFVPHADGMEFAQVLPYLVEQGYPRASAGQWLHAAVFALDIYQVVVGCGTLVLNLNGRVPDEGAVAEAAMAWMLGKPIVVFKEDARSAIAGRDNPLIVGMTDFETVAAIADVPPALQEAVARSAGHEDDALACPAHLVPIVERGEALWQRLASLGSTRPTPQVAEMVLELFGPHPEASSR